MRKGISPVIATVIIVAVAIAIAVAVAFWMTGIVGLYTRYEKLEIVNAYADWNSTDHVWVIVLQIRNAGSSDATIDEIFINGRPHDAWTNVQDSNYGYYNERKTLSATDLHALTSNPKNDKVYTQNKSSIWIIIGPDDGQPKKFDFTHGVPLKSGDEMTIVILWAGPGSDNPVPFKHGASVEVKIHTASGKEYPKEIVLP